MQETTIAAKIDICSYSELSRTDKKLVSESKSARSSSYAPYSDYNVGAAILLSNGCIVRGSNQENVAYPSGLCAERVAVFAAKSSYPDVNIEAIALSASIRGEEVVEPIAPCGACRQVLLEYEQKQGSPIKILMIGSSKIVIAHSVETLLPLSFKM